MTSALRTSPLFPAAVGFAILRRPGFLSRLSLRKLFQKQLPFQSTQLLPSAFQRALSAFRRIFGPLLWNVFVHPCAQLRPALCRQQRG
jgi:hypothetical protein